MGWLTRKNSAYSAVTDLYNEDLDGSVVGTITYGTSTEISINNDTVTNIGLRAQKDTRRTASSRDR